MRSCEPHAQGPGHEAPIRIELVSGRDGGQRATTTKAALVDGRTDVGILPTGRVAETIEELPTVAEVIGSIIDEASAILDGWA